MYIGNSEIKYRHWINFAVFFFTFLSNAVHATTYYVSTTGNNSNPGTSSQPFRTIEKGVRSISAGDTLYVKSGTYSESIRHWQVPIPNGTSWNNPIMIAANPGDTVIIKPLSDNAFFWIGDGQNKYLIIKGFIVDAARKALHGFKFENGTKYVRVINTEIKNAKDSGILVSATSPYAVASNNTYHEFINLHVHHNGTSVKDHGFYIQTSHNLIEYSDVHHNSATGGKFYSATFIPGTAASGSANHNTIRYSTLHDNSQNSTIPADGWILASGTGNKAYGNTVYNQPIGLTIGFGATNASVYNNVIYSNTDYGIRVTGAFGGSSNTLVANNTIYQNSVYGIFSGDNASNTTVRNNIVRSNTIDLGLDGAVSSNNFTGNPLFVNAGAKDFHLQAGSSAIDTGIGISGINNDFDGTSRPQGSNFDIGAYEFQSGSGGSSGGGSFPPPISSPAPGSTIGSSVTFTGAHTSQDLEHWLYVGTSTGANNLHNSGSMGSSHNRTISGLPSSGTIYVRYWTRNSSGWSSRDHTYIMTGGGSFPPPISSPAPGSTIGSSVTFTGAHTSQDLEHWLYVGTSTGANNLHNSGSMGSSHNRTISGLPSSGTIYVRYWTRNSSGWSSRDHTYIMTGGGSFPPPISSPAPGSTIGSSVTFTGAHTSQDLEHWLYVGTSTGAKNIYNSGSMGSGHSRSVTGIPSGTIYVRYWTRNSSGWSSRDHTYVR